MENGMITAALQQYNITDAAIAKYKAEYMALAVQGATDEEGYKIVKSARMEIVHKRTDVEKKRKELNSDALKYKKAVDDEAKRITALLAPIEDHLVAQERIVDDEKARIKAEAESKEAARIQERIDRLFALGCSFNGQNYILPFAPTGYAVPSPLAKSCNDEQFEQICGEFQKLVDAEQIRVANELIEKEKERQRIESVQAEQKAEAERLDAIAKEQAEKEAKIKAAEEKIEKEKQRLIDEENERVAAADREKQRVADEKRRAEELEKAKVEAAEKAVRDLKEKEEREEAEKIEKERLAKIAAEKKAARQPDKVKLLIFADSIDGLEGPEMKTDAGAAIVAEFETDLSRITKTLREKAEEM